MDVKNVVIGQTIGGEILKPILSPEIYELCTDLIC